jgi:hypothetical protein
LPPYVANATRVPGKPAPAQEARRAS